MTKVVALYNIKGGVGKTSAAVNLAWTAAEQGSRVLLWDLDPQGAASFLLRIKPKVRGGGSKLVRGKSDPAALLKGSDHERLDLLPADFSYRNMDLVLDATKRPTHGPAARDRAARRRLRLRLPRLPAGDLAGVGERLRGRRRPARAADPDAAVAAHVRAAAALRRRRGPQAAPARSWRSSRWPTAARRCTARSWTRSAPRGDGAVLRRSDPGRERRREDGARSAARSPRFAPRGRAARAYAALWDELGARLCWRRKRPPSSPQYDRSMADAPDTGSAEPAALGCAPRAGLAARARRRRWARGRARSRCGRRADGEGRARLACDVDRGRRRDRPCRVAAHAGPGADRARRARLSRGVRGARSSPSARRARAWPDRRRRSPPARRPTASGWQARR